MSKSLLDDAFAHHTWATLRLIDACRALSAEQVATNVPGTYGSILDTVRHIVGADSWYLFRITDDRSFLIDRDRMDLPELRATMESNGAAWSRILEGPPDADAMLVEHTDDGSETHDPTGIVLAQALHHGTDHRSQVCTALTTIGVEPPDIDVWFFGVESGRSVDVPRKPESLT